MSAAEVDEYFPASQSVQLEDEAELKEPASQAKHVSDDIAPVAELYRPATQSMQDSAATTADAYFPASQSVQPEDAEELKEPASQAKQLTDAAELYRPATQSVQVSEDSAAEVDEYLPASQSVQLEDAEEL